MGIIKAAIGAVGGVLADSWLETIEPGPMSDTTVMACGVLVNKKDKRSSNRKGTADVISNGSIIHVYPNQMMILTDGGKIIDYSAEEGYYEVQNAGAPSLFNGDLNGTVLDTFNRFKFGGTPSGNQKVFYINLQEIKGIKFGTRNAVNYFDNFYNAELFIRAHGSYSIKITDPLKFFAEAIPRNAQYVDISDINSQYLDEFMSALQAAINQLSVDGVRISTLPSKSLELSRYMSKVLDEDWKNLRGMEICSVGIASISYNEESQQLINMRNKGAMLSDPAIREGYVQGSVAGGLEAAGSNRAGAGQAYMAMGLGMQGAGGFMQAASQTNAAQMQQQKQSAPVVASSEQWTCSCGKQNSGKFCSECGKPKPQETMWKCSCGQENTGNFCSQCGKPKSSDTEKWKCVCGYENTGNFCSQCGQKRS